MVSSPSETSTESEVVEGSQGPQASEQGEEPGSEQKSPASASVSPVRARSVSRSLSRRPQPKRRLVNCWYGRECRRADCWFHHPRGRIADERRTKPACPTPRGRSPSRGSLRRKRTRRCFRRRAAPKRFRSRSASKSPKPKRPRHWKEAEPMKDLQGTAKDMVKATEKPSGKLDFRDFVVHHFVGGSADEALEAFKVYRKEMAEKEFQSLKSTNLFLDRYHPLRQLRLYDWRRSLTRSRATSFAQDLQEGRYARLSLRAKSPVGSMSCPVAGHLEPPEFAFDANVGTLLIKELPPAVSAWEVLDLLQDLEGFVTASFDRGDARELRACFVGAVEARGAMAALEEAQLLNGATRARVALMEDSELNALVLPPEMSAPSQLEKDLQLSTSVVRRLNELQGIPGDVEALVLEVEGPVEFKLDLRVLYLRRVHHFCFYAGKWCQDEWSLRDSCGAALIREPHSGEDHLWAKDHEKRILDFLNSAESACRPRPDVSLDETKLQSRMQEVCHEKMVRLSEQKFQCHDCGKLFKGSEYVCRHILRAHPKVMEEVREEFYEGLARVSYLADANRVA